jgi:4-hydroxymandelate oxidase
MRLPSTRRRALQAAGLWFAASPLANPQDGAKLQGEPPGRIAPRGDLVNVFEMEAMARQCSPARDFGEIAGGDDRTAFDRITFRPRMLFDVTQLDLTLDLFGARMYAPILIGPASDQKRFHPDGEVAMARGAAAAQAAMVISDRSSQPVEKIAAEAKSTPLWYQIYPESDMAPVLERVKRALSAGCGAICISVGAPYRHAPASSLELTPMASPRVDWSVIGQVRRAAQKPVLIKGIMNPDEARAAAQHGVDGIIVSAPSGRVVHGIASPIEMLPAVVDAVAGAVPVLVDGGFRRGTDVLAALALGARAVLVTRPALWGLTAYGADGVQTVMEMLQSETARDMALCGKRNLVAIDRTLVKVHL